MSLSQILTIYITLNILICLAAATALLIDMMKRKRYSLQSRSELKISYALVAAVIVISAVQPLMPKGDLFKPAAMVWSAGSMKSFANDYAEPDSGGYLSIPAPGKNKIVGAEKVKIALFLICVGIMFAGAWRISRDLRALFAIKRSSFLIKKLDGISVFVNEEISVPFSFWLPNQKNVVLPSFLLSSHDDFEIALRHEIQHHRQGDTRWIYAVWFLKLVCFLNPMIHLWNRLMLEVQEFACDEALVDRQNVDSRAYASCLLKVAETAVGQKGVPVCATGLTFLHDRNILKRRVEMMIKTNKIDRGRFFGWIVCALVVGTMSFMAYASQGIVQDRRVTNEQAKAMAKKIGSNSEIPIVLNSAVLKQLNRFVGTPEGRDLMKSSLNRMKDYRPKIENMMKEYGVPDELLAIPLIESGYKNVPQGSNPATAAGLWQFIRTTAKRYGLKIDDKTDERLDVDLLTDAAMRLLLTDKLIFKSWPLAILAYNVGEIRVQDGIDKTGSRDVWKLINAGFENGKDYYPKFMAALLIMNDPSVLE